MSKILKIAVACDDELGLNGQVSAHFGRCPFYCLVEVRDGAVGEVKALSNPYFDNHRPGAVPGFIKSLEADVILSGGMGPKAIDLFRSYAIETATGISGNVAEAVGAYLRGEVAGTVPCDHDHPDSCGRHGA